jgi:hypothetical protein
VPPAIVRYWLAQTCKLKSPAAGRLLKRYVGSSSRPSGRSWENSCSRPGSKRTSSRSIPRRRPARGEKQIAANSWMANWVAQSRSTRSSSCSRHWPPREGATDSKGSSPSLRLRRLPRHSSPANTSRSGMACGRAVQRALGDALSHGRRASSDPAPAVGGQSVPHQGIREEADGW